MLARSRPLCAVLFAAAIAALATARAAPVLTADPLPQFNASLSDVTVSGLSSGAFMAVQLHTAFSSFIRGAAIFAGGQYDCAAGDPAVAVSICMTALPVAPNPAVAIATADSRAALGWIDPPGVGLGSSRVMLFTGQLDTTVNPIVVDALFGYYSHYGANVVLYGNISAAHTQPTDDPRNTNPCALSAEPYLSNCDFDGAGHALNHIVLPNAQPLPNPRNSGQLTGQLIAFDQRPYVPAGDTAALSLADAGFAFVPADCAAGAACRVHLSLHGCLQYSGLVGDAYAANAGFNKWADTNSIVVLYPQTIASDFVPLNPDGCWDWWGYAGLNYDVQSGAQMQFLLALLKAVTTSGAATLAPAAAASRV